MSEMRTPPTDPGDQRGATPVSGARRDGGRKRGLLFGALLVAALVVLALLLSQCGGDDPGSGTDAAGQTSRSAEGSASASAPESSSATPSGAAPTGGAAGGDGQVVTADGRQVLQLAAALDSGSALAGLVDQSVTATGARVLAVPADEGFWLGTSESERIWVQLTGEAGESPYQVQEGDLVDFEGTVVSHQAGFAEQVGLDAAEGAEQLDGQTAHLEVAKSSVRLSA